MNFFDYFFSFKSILLVSLFFFLVSGALGFVLAGRLPRYPIRLLNLSRIVDSTLEGVDQVEIKTLFLLLYFFLILSFIYLFSFVFGLGPFLIICILGIVSGTALAAVREAPLSFFLVYPFGVLETLLLLVSCASGFQICGAVTQGILLGKDRIRKQALSSLRLFLLLLPFFAASHFLDKWIVSLIFRKV